MRIILSIAVCLLLSTASLFSQSRTTVTVTPGPGQTAITTQTRTDVPVYRVEVVERTIPTVPAVLFREDETKLDLRGSALMPNAHGDLEIETKGGYTQIRAEFRDMPAATNFGPEYLTYVMWGITPEGRAHNLGEV